MVTNRVATKVRKMLTTEQSILYRPMDKQWSYSHHASICKFKGVYHAIWSNGERDEDDLRQRVMHATSADGVHWSTHHLLFPSQEGVVLTAGGLYTQGDRLNAYAGSYQYRPENVSNGKYITINDQHMNTSTLCKTTLDGINWEKSMDLGIPMVPNHGPQPLRSGRLLISGGVTFPISDDPSGISLWQMRGLSPCPWEDMYDDSEGVMRHAALRNDQVFLCEGSFFQTDDDSIHMLLRSDKRVLYETVSRDDGETWSKPEATTFDTANTKFHCGRLADGRFYIVGSPDPAGARCPLVISVSDDGKVFDREYVIDGTFRPIRQQGKYKGGIYGYPHSLIADGKMHVICSINKEDIHVYTFDINQL